MVKMTDIKKLVLAGLAAQAAVDSLGAGAKEQGMKGYFIELRDLSKGRIVFSAATGDLSEDAFMRLWTAVGTNIYKTQSASEKDRWNTFELRITPMTD